MSGEAVGPIRAATLILFKDLRLRARDRSVFVMALVAPFGLALILNTVIDSADDIAVEYGLVDEDGGEVAVGFEQALTSIEDLDLDLTTDLSEPEALDLIERDKLDAAFVIPAGFSDAVRTDTAPAGSADASSLEVTVLGNLDSPLGTQIASAIAGQLGHRLDAARLSVLAVLTSGSVEGDLDEVAAAAAAEPPSVQVAELAAGDRELDDTTYLIAGMAVLFLFFTVSFGVMGVFEERDQGTQPRLRAAPIPRGSLLAAKVLGSVVLGLGATTTLVVASSLLMGAHWGDLPTVALLSVAVVLAAVSITGVVVAVARTAERALAVQSVVAMALAVVGGSFFPVARGEGWLARLSVLTPHRWFLQGLGDGLAGGVGEVTAAVGALLAFATVFGVVGVLAGARKAQL